MSTRDQTAADNALTAARNALADPKTKLPDAYRSNIGEIASAVAIAVLNVRTERGLAHVRRLHGSQAWNDQYSLIYDYRLDRWPHPFYGMDFPMRAAIAAAAEAVVAVYGRQKKES